MKLALSQKGQLIGKSIFLNKIKKTGRDFQNAPEINTTGTKKNRRNSHTKKQGIGKEENKYKVT